MIKENAEEYNLIEYVLNLLSHPEYVEIMEHGGELPVSEDFDRMRMAYDMKGFIDEIPGGFLIYRADGGEEIIYANKALIRIFGCDDFKDFRKLTKGSFRGIVFEEDLDSVESSIKKQIHESRYDLDYVEYRIKRKDGEIRHVEDYGHFVHSETVGDIFYVFITDATEKIRRHLSEKAELINEKKEKEKKIQRLIKEYDKGLRLINQEHLRRLEVIEGLSVNYESILYADLDTDRVLPYRLSSRTEHQFKSRAKVKVRGFRWFAMNYVDMWVHPEDRALVTKATDPDYIREKLAGNKTYYINYRIIKDGKLQYIQLRMVNVGNKKRISQVVLGYRNVDEEILQELKQKQILEDALERAKSANIAKNTFLSNMSHDMRTPLNAVFGFTELAKKNLTDTKAVQTYLAKIETAGRHMLELVDKVLELSYTESQDIAVTETECDISDIVREVYRTFAPLAAEKGQEFILDDAVRDREVLADGDKLRQVLSQLVANAVKYTEEGGKIVIKMSQSDEHANGFNKYRIDVVDTGIGIGNDILPRIFEPFERENNTTTSGIYGTGLGLTIAKSLTEAMGGSIEVESAHGKGSTFTVILGLRTADTSRAMCTDMEQTLSELMKKKILLVEDNEINLEIETEILEGLGFKIDTAVNGEIAVSKMRGKNATDYALVLMDIQMPVLDGRAAAKKIRSLENPFVASVPIVALSANAFESDIKLSLEAGMDAHLTKPLDIPVLLKTVAETLQSRRTV